MNKLVKTILSATAFSALIGVAHADVETLGFGGGGHQPPKPPTGCTELCSSASIPIEIVVPKTCHLTDVSTKINLNSSTGKGNGGFTIKANAKYNLLVDTDNQQSGINQSELRGPAGSSPIKTTVKTTRGSTNINLGSVKYDEPMTAGTSPNNYAIDVQTTGSLGVDRPAGTYTDQYNIKVYF